MFFKQTHLFQGMSNSFTKEFMHKSTKESHKAGYFLFIDGKRAKHFYILVKGRVKLIIGENGHTVYTVDQPGEAFGWSSLVDRGFYSASAECMESTELLKFDVKKVQKILEKDPVNGLIFFKHLASILGTRLLQTYKMISSTHRTDMSTSFGTGQVLESEMIIV